LNSLSVRLVLFLECERLNLLVSKITFSFDANSVASVFQNAANPVVDEMTLP
jgi:hypothetical protein